MTGIFWSVSHHYAVVLQSLPCSAYLQDVALHPGDARCKEKDGGAGGNTERSNGHTAVNVSSCRRRLHAVVYCSVDSLAEQGLGGGTLQVSLSMVPAWVSYPVVRLDGLPVPKLGPRLVLWAGLMLSFSWSQICRHAVGWLGAGRPSTRLFVCSCRMLVNGGHIDKSDSH